MNPSPWIDAGASDELVEGRALLLRHEGRQYALWRTAQGELFACDNACPHEGYPLLQGYTEDCVLTCAWHNFKFDLRDGRCVVGEEDLVVYPLRERKGRIEVDLTPQRGAERQARLWKSLESALHENRLAQAARDSARLLQTGISAERIAVFAAAFDGRHAPWGSSHALPVAVDLLRYFQREAEDPLLALLQVLQLAAESGQLRPEHPEIAPQATSIEPTALRLELLAAIEAEEADRAEALLRAAVEAGIDWPQVESWLLEACCAHFLSFGHQLIYIEKVAALREHADPEEYLEILVGLLRDIVFGTREDTLPPMQATRLTIEEHHPDFAEWMALGADDREWPAAEREAFRLTVLDGRSSEVPAALVALLRAGISRKALADELVIAAAERVLRFDAAIELDPGVRENWLHVTHTLTFAAAVRSVLARSELPCTLALLFHATHFIRHKKALDRDEEFADFAPLAARPAVEGENMACSAPSGSRANTSADTGTNASAEACAVEVELIVQAVLRGDRPEALELLEAYLGAHGLDARLTRAVEDLALRHRAVLPIRCAHILKTLVVGLQESARLGDDPHAAWPLAAALAFASAPMDERGAERIAREAAEFVREGRPPRRLTP